MSLLFEDAGIPLKTLPPSLLSDAEELVECVGRLPLALVQAASFMKETGTSLDDMLKLYKSEERIEVGAVYLMLHEQKCSPVLTGNSMGE